MDDPLLGEIRAFGFGRVPEGWALCDGSLLPVRENAALFSLLGTRFGGNGHTDFALPDLRGRTLLGLGAAPGGGDYTLGELGGVEGVALSSQQIPQHDHQLYGNGGSASAATPGNGVPAMAASQAYSKEKGSGSMAADALALSGAGAPHNNMQPSLVVNYCIATSGYYPSRP